VSTTLCGRSLRCAAVWVRCLGSRWMLLINITLCCVVYHGSAQGKHALKGQTVSALQLLARVGFVCVKLAQAGLGAGTRGFNFVSVCSFGVILLILSWWCLASWNEPVYGLRVCGVCTHSKVGCQCPPHRVLCTGLGEHSILPWCAMKGCISVRGLGCRPAYNVQTLAGRC
jgi:hypothetical protein